MTAIDLTQRSNDCMVRLYNELFLNCDIQNAIGFC